MKNRITNCALAIAVLALTTTVKSQTINTVAGNDTAGYSGDGGQATAAEISQPWAVVVDGSNNMYIADYANNVIRMVNASGIITTIAGNGTSGYSGDGAAATAAELASPGGVALDASGNLYINDNSNNVVRMVNASGIITTIAGNGTSGYSGDGAAATAAELNLNGTGQPIVDAGGNLYIPDDGNNVVRMVNPAGIITTIAGNNISGYSGDGGQATNAELYNPDALDIDASGNLYIADGSNSVIRMVDPTGIITTIIGNGTSGYSGDGGPATAAELNNAYGISFDAVGNFYVADGSNYCIRMVDPSGTITTFAGTGVSGFSGDGGPATAAEISSPYSVFSNSAGDVFIPDEGNNVIREVTIAPNSVKGLVSDGNKALIYPNPFNNTLSISISAQATVTMFDMIGQNMGSWILNKGMHNINTEAIPAGTYMLQIKTESGVLTKKLVKM